MTTFSQLSQGDSIYVLEVTGTFKKTTNYCLGTISSVSKSYEEQLPPQQFPMPNQVRKKLVDITIVCDGESKKLSVEENKTIITDTSIGLTIATDKKQIVDMIKRQYDEYKIKKEAAARYDEEMSKCESILRQLDYKEQSYDDPKIESLQREVDELKNILRQANQLVPPGMKQALPQDIQNKLNEVSQ